MMAFWSRKQKPKPEPAPPSPLYSYREARAQQESEKAAQARALWLKIIPPATNPIADMLMEAKEGETHA
jgi:hypothetical protein